MAKKRYSSEQNFQLLRKVEIHKSEGKTIAQFSSQIGVTEQLRDDLLNGEIFTSLKETQILTERWRWGNNESRTHSALNYQPSAPSSVLPKVQGHLHVRLILKVGPKTGAGHLYLRHH